MFRIDTTELGYYNFESTPTNRMDRRENMKVIARDKKREEDGVGEDSTRLTIVIDRDMRRKLKIICVTQGITMREVITRFIEKSIKDGGFRV